jgi:hypothetical protein
LVANSERLGRLLADQGYPVHVAPDPTADGLIAGLTAVAAAEKADK